VFNLAPNITSKIETPISRAFGKSSTYNLPTSIDPEGFHYNTTIKNGPPFVELISSTQV
jgi:hypothetical protein